MNISPSPAPEADPAGSWNPTVSHRDAASSEAIARCERHIRRLISVAVLLPAGVGMILWEADHAWSLARGPIVAVIVATGFLLSVYVRRQIASISMMYMEALTVRPKPHSHAAVSPADRCKQNLLHRV